jgi:hypothetical protein
MTTTNKSLEALRELERGWRAFAKSTWPPEPTTSGFEWHNPVYSENEIQLLNKHADQLAALLPALEQQMQAAVAAAYEQASSQVAFLLRDAPEITRNLLVASIRALASSSERDALNEIIQEAAERGEKTGFAEASRQGVILQTQAVYEAVNNCLRKRDVEWRKALGWNETFLMYPDDVRAKLETLLREARLEEIDWAITLVMSHDEEYLSRLQKRRSELSAAASVKGACSFTSAAKGKNDGK